MGRVVDPFRVAVYSVFSTIIELDEIRYGVREIKELAELWTSEFMKELDRKFNDYSPLEFATQLKSFLRRQGVRKSMKECLKYYFYIRETMKLSGALEKALLKAWPEIEKALEGMQKIDKQIEKGEEE